MSQQPIIMWFRDDLRLSDNQALYEAAKGREVIPVYIHDETNDEIRKRGAASKWWLHHALTSLQNDLKNKDADLLVFKGKTEDVLDKLIKQSNASAVYLHESYVKPIRDRDNLLRKKFESENISFKAFAGYLLFHPDAVKTQDENPYKVYSPFWRACMKQTDSILELFPIPHTIKLPAEKIKDDGIEALELLPSIGWDASLHETWNISEKEAHARLDHFLQNDLKNYSKGRDFPAKKHISNLSPYLHFGMISPRTIWHETQGYVASMQSTSQSAADKFLSELGWRDFCGYLLYHFPSMRTEPFRKEFKNFPWISDGEMFDAWKKGETGYPLVDAGMRELWQTGVMHNRVRMVVASFLIKHLQLHWQEGEAWFWDTLVDADYASNIANWQWVAGCGADAAPYFRVFNPILQSKKFDGEAEYVRRYVPELAKLSDSAIHTPWELGGLELAAASVVLGKDYPYPIVKHEEARDRALAAYKEIK